MTKFRIRALCAALVTAIPAFAQEAPPSTAEIDKAKAEKQAQEMVGNPDVHWTTKGPMEILMMAPFIRPRDQWELMHLFRKTAAAQGLPAPDIHKKLKTVLFNLYQIRRLPAGEQPVRNGADKSITVDLTAEDDTMALPRLDSLERKLKDLEQQFAPLDVVLVESGGDNLTATFSPALVDVQVFVLDVAGGGDVARKGGVYHVTTGLQARFGEGGVAISGAARKLFGSEIAKQSSWIEDFDPVLKVIDQDRRARSLVVAVDDRIYEQLVTCSGRVVVHHPLGEPLGGDGSGVRHILGELVQPAQHGEQVSRVTPVPERLIGL